MKNTKLISSKYQNRSHHEWELLDDIYNLSGEYEPNNKIHLEAKAAKFLNFNTYNKLRLLLSNEENPLINLVNYPNYKVFSIPKKRKGSRMIYSPQAALKLSQRRLNYYLQACYSLLKPDCVHGFVINSRKTRNSCSIYSNALPHVGKKHLLNVDIRNFFPSITARKVFDLFIGENFRFPEKTAIILTLLSTYEGRLPAGSPASPVISNFICLKMDKTLMEFCTNHNLTYTRYADDLSFSSDSKITDEQIDTIRSIISTAGFEINKKKLRITSSASRQTVTGLTVNQKVNPSRRLIKLVRAMRHDLNTNGLEAATQRHYKLKTPPPPKLQQLFLNKLIGLEGFVKWVREMGRVREE